MPTREQVLDALRRGSSYDDVAGQFGIPPGQAYLIATGLPADGSDVLGPEYLSRREDLLMVGSQTLVNPPSEAPTTNETVLAWLKRRAASDAQMQRAAAARTAEPPPEQELNDDVIDVLGRDHGQIKYLQQQLKAIPGVSKGGSEAQQQMRVSIVDMIRMRASQHETAEEEYFWPVVRDELPDGAHLADTALQQEQEGKDLLQRLDGMSGDDEQFDELATQLISALRKHVAFEDMVFLKVKEKLSEERRAELGRKVRRAREHAPTRPHPHGPDSGGGSKIASAMAAPLDRARDAAGDRPAKRKGKPEGSDEH